MENHIFISIIIPVYKVEEYIEHCLRSVMEQTYKEQPVECILVDDCGKDNSMNIAKQLLKAYNGPYTFKIIENEKNQGVASSRNNGIRASSGEYIFFLDSDDHITPDCLEILTKELEAHPQADVVLGNVFSIAYNRQLVKKRVTKGIIPKKRILEYFFHGDIPHAMWNMLIKADLVKRNEIYFVDGMIHCEDTNWSFRLYCQTEMMVFVPHTTLIYEDRPTSTMNTIGKNYATHLKWTLYNVNYILEHFPKPQYVDATLFIIWTLNYELDFSSQKTIRDTIGKDLTKELKRTRNKLLWHDVSHFRIILALFDLTMYLPLSLLNKLAYYRHNYHVFAAIVRKMALFFSPLHIFSK